VRQFDQSKPCVTFVVVNWNQCQLTLDCLASLYQQSYPNFSVVLVDNGSQDESVSTIRKAYPDVTIIEHRRNLGIAAANNSGIRQALQLDTDYIFLLNNDTVVAPDMLTSLVEVAEHESDIGITGPTMLYFDHPETIWSAGNKLDWHTGMSFLLRNNEPVSSVSNASCEEVDYIATCAACIKRTVFENVGLMDERFFIYYDETDWFARASAAGWRSVYVPQAKMWHKVSATMGQSSPTTDYYMVRNKYLFLTKNLRGYKKILALTRAALFDLRVILAYTVKDQKGTRRGNRNAKLFALRDVVLGRWGQTSLEF
jgi:GT2 family glycosyltransferase